MSITLPPFPIGVAATDRMREYATAYATTAVEAYIASRVPMTEAQILEELGTGFGTPRSRLLWFVRVVEAHHGIGAKP